MNSSKAAVRLTRFQSVLVMAKCEDVSPADDVCEPSGIYFAVPSETSSSGFEWPGLGIEHDRWCEMGCPEKLTVTVEPGDCLNGGN